MKAAALFPAIVALCLSGCATGPITSAQAVAIGEPLVAGGLTLVLKNNPSYIPVAQKVGADLSSQNWSDLTLTGINAAVAAAVKKEGGNDDLKSTLTAAIDAGLGAYLGAVSEQTLANDPNAVGVLQALGQAITTAASAVSASS